MADRIPKKELARARRTLCRQVAAAIITAMGETDTGFSIIDKRRGKKMGHTKTETNKLISGVPILWDAVSDILWAMGCQGSLSLRPLPKIEEPA